MTTQKFNMKNYTTSVSAERSIAEIEKLLASFGATAIMKDYLEDARVHALSFKLEEKVFKLPANITGVQAILYKDKRAHHGRDVMKGREKRAYMVAWRIIKDWIHAQLSLISSGQAHPHEIFLPYMFDGKRTLYEVYVEGNLLTEGKKAK